MPNKTTRALKLLGAAQGRSLMTTGSIAARFGCPVWAVRRLFERNMLPPADRIGAYRIIAEADLPKIREALVAAGYLAADADKPASVTAGEPATTGGMAPASRRGRRKQPATV